MENEFQRLSSIFETLTALSCIYCSFADYPPSLPPSLPIQIRIQLTQTMHLIDEGKLFKVSRDR